MINRNKADILGAYVDIVNTEQALQSIKELSRNGQPNHIITLNAEIVYQAQEDPDLLRIINEADLVTPDGIGIVWAGRKLGNPFQERVTGIDLLYHLCSEAVKEGWRIYLLGAAPGVAEAAGRQLCNSYPGLQICGFHDGYFSEQDIPGMLDGIREVRPDLLFVALGAPKQEFWIRRYMQQLNVPVSIGVGGSFDVVAGIKERAPQWVITANLEWLYRLLKEPSRFQRQLALPKFAWLVLKRKYMK